MTFESGRNLGFISSLMIVILPVITLPAVFLLTFARVFTPATGFLALSIFYIFIGALGLASYILFLVAMNRLATYYQEPRLYKNVLYAFILNIAGGVVGLIIYISTFLLSPISLTPTPSPADISSIVFRAILAMIIFVIVVFVFAIISAVLYMRTFNLLADKTGVDNFRTAGLLYIIGVLLAVVLVGALVVWVAWILAAMGFYSLKEKPYSPLPTPAKQTTPAVDMARKICPYCGTENNADAIYCKACGKQL